MSRVTGTKDPGSVNASWNQYLRVAILSSSSLPSMFIDQVGAQSGLISPQIGLPCSSFIGPLT